MTQTTKLVTECCFRVPIEGTEYEEIDGKSFSGRCSRCKEMAVLVPECDHDHSDYWCPACGKPAFYENLCSNCGPVNTRQCLDCGEEYEVPV